MKSHLVSSAESRSSAGVVSHLLCFIKGVICTHTHTHKAHDVTLPRGIYPFLCPGIPGRLFPHVLFPDGCVEGCFFLTFFFLQIFVSRMDVIQNMLITDSVRGGGGLIEITFVQFCWIDSAPCWSHSSSAAVLIKYIYSNTVFIILRYFSWRFPFYASLYTSASLQSSQIFTFYFPTFI